MGYSCYLIDKESKITSETKHRNVFLHHITEECGIPDNSETPAHPESVKVVGYCCDDKAEAYIVEVNGTIIRPDRGIYHIAASCSDGVKPYYSNKLIQKGWAKIPGFEISVTPHIVGFS